MRTLKSILLAGAMLLATPAFFSSCQEDAPQIDYTMSVTVVNDFSKVVDAINNGTLKNEQAIAQLTAAIDKMNADQQTKLQAIKDVLNSLNATVDTKLAAIEAAMKAQTITLEGKLALIEDAMKAQTLALEKKCDALVAAIKALPDYTEKLQAIEKAISALPDYTSKLEAIEKALTSQTKELSEKLAFIEAAMKDQTVKLDDKLAALEKAIKALPDYTEQLQAIKTAIDGLPDYNDKLAAIETAMKDQTKKLSEKLAFIEAAMKTQTLTLSAKINTLNTILALHSIDMSLKLNAIKKAIENMPDYTAAFNNIKNEIANLVKAVEDGNKSEADALAEIAKKLEELKAAGGIGGGSEPMPIPKNCIDLGLPSGLLWAKSNMGTTDPKEIGDYYAWGETSTKKKYYSTNYKHYTGIDLDLKKYNEKDRKTVLELEDDAANANLGVGYRIPTQEDWQELLDNCKWEAVTTTLPIELDPAQRKGIARWKVTGPNGKSIVLPMTGGFRCDTWFDDSDEDTYYTTANLWPVEELSKYDKYERAVVLTWPLLAKKTSSGSIKKPTFISKRRYFGVVVRPVFDRYSDK